jgi:hypothetical protein
MAWMPWPAATMPRRRASTGWETAAASESNQPAPTIGAPSGSACLSHWTDTTLSGNATEGGHIKL